MKRCSTSLIIREMQIKTHWDAISHLSEWLSSINQQTGAAEMWRKGNPCALLVGMQTGAASVESSMEIPQKIKNGTTLWPSDLTSGNMSKGTQNTDLKEYKHPYVHCSVICNHQIWKHPKGPSVDEWIKQPWDIYTMEYYSAIKKKILPSTTVWLELEDIMLSERSQQRKANTIWFHSYVESNEQTELTRKMGTDS